MQPLIEHIRAGIEGLTSWQPPLAHQLVQTLEGQTALDWIADYPVALVHTRDRLKDPGLIDRLDALNLFNADGTTIKAPNAGQLAALHEQAADAMQYATLAVLQPETPAPQFANKHDGDFWKKLLSAEGMRAIIEIDSFGSDDTACLVESSLRDIIRKRKEVHALKPVPFIWLAVAPQSHLTVPVATHYFGHDTFTFTHLDRQITIAWSPSLGAINMRTFLCPPDQN